MKAAKSSTSAKPVNITAPEPKPSIGLAISVSFAALILLFFIYLPALNGPFVFDDEYLPFRDPGFLENGIPSLSPTARPLQQFTFWLNLKFFGIEPFSYHFVNLLFHFTNSILMFAAIRKLLEYANESSPLRDWIAACAAALFLLHPANTESVAYVAGRSESFSLMWFLSSYTLFLYKRRGGIEWIPALGVLALFGCAFLSKEHTAVLPALFVLTDILFPEKSPIETIKRNWKLYIPTIVAGSIGAYLVWQVVRRADTVGFALKDLPWYDYFYTQWRVIWIYLRLFFAPFSLNADYDIAISRSPLDHAALFFFIGLLALLAVSFVYRKRFPLAFAGLLIFFLLLAPTSSIVPIKDPAAERRLYLPMIGLLLIVCDLIRYWKPSRNQLFATVGSVLFVFSYLTYARASVWGDSLTLWQDTVEKNPRNFRARFQLAMAYFESRQFEVAIEKFAEAEKVSTKKDYTLYIDWGLAYDALNQPDKALEKFHQAAAVENKGHARALIGMALAKQGKNAEALEELNKAANIDPNYEMTYVYRGNVYQLMNEFTSAEAQYRKALEINPNNEVARTSIANLARKRSGSR